MAISQAGLRYAVGINMNKFNKTFLISITLVLLLGISLFLYEINSYTKVGGLFWINDKQTINNEYFIYVGYSKPWIKLQCTKQEYIKIIVDEKVGYSMEFERKVHYPSKGKLISIDLVNIIDNRNK